jgi:hypothetical protein
MIKEKMIMFNGDMVRAILEGRKTQTRRIMNPQPTIIQHPDEGNHVEWRNLQFDFINDIPHDLQPGDTMLVRERVRLTSITTPTPLYKTSDPVTKGDVYHNFTYEADGEFVRGVILPERIKPIALNHCVPNGCFKELVRIKRKVLRVWFEQIQDISDDDAMAEGITLEQAMSHCCSDGFRAEYSVIWEDCYGKGSWDRNVWVECTEFEGVTE